MSAHGQFEDLLLANRRFAGSSDRLTASGARAGVAVLTCMDSRLDPLGMLGLALGDAKVLRTPGGHLTPDALRGCILASHLLGVRRVLVIQHTGCAMAAGDDAAVKRRVFQATGVRLGAIAFGADPDQRGRLRRDVAALRAHRMIADQVLVGGFLYDLETGLLEEVA